MECKRRGITLPEVVVTVAVMGIIAGLIPILFRVLHSASYLQRMSYLQNEAKNVLWQISHDVDNAADIKFILSADGITPDPDKLTIYVYDLKEFNPDGSFEHPALYLPANWGQIDYQIVVGDDGAGNDLNHNGIAEEKPYLLRHTHWNDTFGGRALDRYETLFLGTIEPTPLPWNLNTKTFEALTNQLQTVKINFRLRPAFSRPDDAPRLFTSVVTMRNPKPGT